MSLKVKHRQSSLEIDQIKVDEVISVGENNSYCYKHLINDYLSNLQKKYVRGVYDKEKATKLLEYYYSNYVRREAIKYLSYDPALNVAERKLFGEHFRDYLYNEFLKNIKIKK
jgi:hypothetical protein